MMSLGRAAASVQPPPRGSYLRDQVSLKLVWAMARLPLASFGPRSPMEA